MKFTKMHGIGNDYVYVNCFEETVKDPSAVAKFVSDRHFGIGSDGLILIRPSEIADCEMDMYNLDGSQGAMCGNGIRCVAKYVYDHGIVDKTSLSIATRSGIKYVDLTIRDGKASMVKVNMGSPILTAKEIPVVAETEQVINAPITVDGKEYHRTAVSMGNPHAIIYVDDVDSLDLEKIGPSFENHVCFPDRVNTEFGLSGSIDPVHQHGSLCWDQKRIHMLRQCGFSGSVMSQNCHKFSCFNVQVHIIDCTLHVYHIAVIIVSLIVKSQLERLDNSHLFCSP